MTADERVQRLTEGIARLERRLRRTKRLERGLRMCAVLLLLAGLAAAGAPRKPEALRLRGLVILDRQGEPALVAGDDGDAGIGLIREEKDLSILMAVFEDEASLNVTAQADMAPDSGIVLKTDEFGSVLLLYDSVDWCNERAALAAMMREPRYPAIDDDRMPDAARTDDGAKGVSRPGAGLALADMYTDLRISLGTDKRGATLTLYDEDDERLFRAPKGKP